MVEHRIDTLAKRLAAPLARRRLLALGTVGLTAPVARVPAMAQTATPPATTAPAVCLVPFTATVRQGPAAGTIYTGVLALAATADGTVHGVLVPPAPRATPAPAHASGVPVSGQTTGRAINLLVTLSPGKVLYGVGTMAQPLATCAGEMGGPFVGPGPGDAGDWAVQQVPLTGCQRGCRADFSRCSSSLSEEELNADVNKCDLSLEGCLTGCDLNGR